ncbi:MAG TPA: DMT family transporter [Gammaproteobacteria bacterium]|jgi:drug/metabolite transporter (DMT)-like permease|nr:DMT family transporter [Gammaproteobacteria bacterium]
MNRLRADFLLLLTAFIWGTAFIAQKDANQSMAPVLFVGSRFLLSALALIPLVIYEARRQGAALSRRDWLQALIVGLCLFAGASLQQVGLVTTTATNGGFLTALYVVIVPFMVWGMARKRPRALVIVACAVSIWGAWLLTDDGSERHWSRGDLLVLLADFAWALAITVIGDFLERTHRPFFLSFAQYAITAVLGLGAGLLFEPVSLPGIAAATPAILYAGLLSGGVAYTLQIVAQKHTPPAEAALIMSLESVFAALAGAVMLHERLTLPAMLGCGLILLGVVLVETGPALMRYMNRAPVN